MTYLVAIHDSDSGEFVRHLFSVAILLVGGGLSKKERLWERKTRVDPSSNVLDRKIRARK